MYKLSPLYTKIIAGSFDTNYYYGYIILGILVYLSNQAWRKVCNVVKA